MSYGKRQYGEIEEDVESDFADMIDFLLSILTTKDGDFVTVAGDTPARTRWRVGRMASRWKGEIERLQAESQQVIDNCLKRARKKQGHARILELQMAEKHVKYINALETGYREIRRLINLVWPLQGMTLIKRLRGEGRVKTAAAIGQQGGAVVNDMLKKYMDGEIPSISSVVTTQALPEPSKGIDVTPTPETRSRRVFSTDHSDEDEEYDDIEDEEVSEEIEEELEELLGFDDDEEDV